MNQLSKAKEFLLTFDGSEPSFIPFMTFYYLIYIYLHQENLIFFDGLITEKLSHLKNRSNLLKNEFQKIKKLIKYKYQKLSRKISCLFDWMSQVDNQRFEKYPPEGKYKLIQKNFIMPEDKFYGESQYTHQYNKKNRAIPYGNEKFVPKNQLSLPNARFEAHSSYVDDYEGKTRGQRAERSPLPKNHVIPEGKFDGDSSYHENYMGNKPDRVKQFRPVEQLKVGEGHFEGHSSYGADYSGKGQAQRSQIVALPRNYVLPEGNFEGHSNYSQNFIGSKSQKLQKFVPNSELKVGGHHFEGTSSYGADYAAKNQALRADRIPLPKNHVLPEGRFEGESLYHETYIKGTPEKLHKFLPEHQIKLEGGPLNAKSSYQADFQSKGNAQRADRVPLPKNHVIPEGRFEGNSAYTSNFIGSKVPQQKQFRPEGELKVGEGKFEGGSSYTIDYDSKGNAIRSERVPLPENHVLPEGRFEGDSTYHGNYLLKKYQKQPQYRPQEELKVGGKFEGVSSYGENYQKKEGGRPQIRRVQELHVPLRHRNNEQRN